MSLQTVRNFFSALNLDLPIIELETSTATVALAAEAHGVEPGRIAKTLAFRLSSGEALLLVARGDARIEHKKFKEVFGKGKMLPLDEVVELTGHPVGGVCRSGWRIPCPSISTARCSPSTRSCRRLAPSIARYASVRCRWRR